MPKDNLIYLSHILERSEKILRFIEGLDEHSFSTDEKTQSAVIREFEVIGEASKRISDDFKDRYQSIPWKIMAGMRDILIPNYEGVSPYRVWDTAQHDIPSLISELKKNNCR